MRILNLFKRNFIQLQQHNNNNKKYLHQQNVDEKRDYVEKLELVPLSKTLLLSSQAHLNTLRTTQAKLRCQLETFVDNHSKPQYNLLYYSSLLNTQFYAF